MEYLNFPNSTSTNDFNCPSIVTPSLQPPLDHSLNPTSVIQPESSVDFVELLKKYPVIQELWQEYRSQAEMSKGLMQKVLELQNQLTAVELECSESRNKMARLGLELHSMKRNSTM
jgi:hypothetical protein